MRARASAASALHALVASRGHSIFGQVSMTTSRPALRARSAAAWSMTPSCIQIASMSSRSLCAMASSTTAPTLAELTKQSMTLTSWSGMSASEA